MPELHICRLERGLTSPDPAPLGRPAKHRSQSLVRAWCSVYHCRAYGAVTWVTAWVREPSMSHFHESAHGFKQVNVVLTRLTCEPTVSSACVLGLRRNVPSAVMWVRAEVWMPEEGARQCPVITPPPAKGVFQRHHGQCRAGLPHERSHVPWVRALAAGDPWGPRGDQPLNARSVHLFPCSLCPPGA